MLNFLRRRKRNDQVAPDQAARDQAPAGETTDVAADAHARAEAFWKRWYELAPEVNAALGDGVPQRVHHQIAEAVRKLHPELTFDIEHGEQAVYALVVSSRENPELRPYTDAWMAGAPRGDTIWEFHDSIPPVPDPTQVTVNLRGGTYPLDQMRIAAQVDAAGGLVDVAVYHPGFADLDSEDRTALTFLPLGATLGERLAADRIGRVETAEREPQGAIGLLEFRELVRELDAEDRGSGEEDETTRAGE